MARDKERAVNPATAALKSQKNASIKKQKASVAAQRTERLANRNPQRLQQQYDDLAALKESSGGKLKPKEQQLLQNLERDLRLIKKAKQSDPAFGNNESKARRDNDDDHSQTLGKRRRGSNDADRRRSGKHSDSEDTDPEVRGIPMPRDTPPPIPRRPNRNQKQEQAKPKAPVQHQTTYSAAPQLRDLRKEATDKFMPASVKARQRDKPTMLEPEEADALEEEHQRRLAEQEAAFQKELGGAGVEDMVKATEEAENEAVHTMIADGVDDSTMGAKGAVERRLHQVEIEEVEDEDGPSLPSRPSTGIQAPPKPAPQPPAQAEEVEEKEDVFSWD